MHKPPHPALPPPKIAIPAHPKINHPLPFQKPMDPHNHIDIAPQNPPDGNLRQVPPGILLITSHNGISIGEVELGSFCWGWGEELGQAKALDGGDGGGGVPGAGHGGQGGLARDLAADLLLLDEQGQGLDWLLGDGEGEGCVGGHLRLHLLVAYADLFYQSVRHFCACWFSA